MVREPMNGSFQVDNKHSFTGHAVSNSGTVGRPIHIPGVAGHKPPQACTVTVDHKHAFGPDSKRDHRTIRRPVSTAATNLSDPFAMCPVRHIQTVLAAVHKPGAVRRPCQSPPAVGYTPLRRTVTNVKPLILADRSATIGRQNRVTGNNKSTTLFQTSSCDAQNPSRIT